MDAKSEGFNPFDTPENDTPGYNPFDNLQSTNPFDNPQTETTLALYQPLTFKTPDINQFTNTPESLKEMAIQEESLNTANIYAERWAEVLRPSQSLLDEFVHYFKTRDLLSQAAGYTLPLVPAGVLGALKLFALFYTPAWFIGTLLGVGVSAITALGFSQRLADSHQGDTLQDNTEYRQRMYNMISSIQILENRNRELTQAMESYTQLYLFEIDELKNCNQKIRAANTGLTQQLMFREATQNALDQNQQELQTEVESLKNNLDDNKTINKNLQEELVRNQETLEKSIQDLNSKTREVETLTQQMEEKKLHFEKTIKALGNTVQSLMLFKMQSDTEKEQVKLALNGVLEQLQGNIGKIHADMEHERARYQENMTEMEVNNKRLAAVIEEKKQLLQKMTEEHRQKDTGYRSYLPALGMFRGRAPVAGVSSEETPSAVCPG